MPKLTMGKRMKKSLSQLTCKLFLHGAAKTQNLGFGYPSDLSLLYITTFIMFFCILYFFRLCQNPLLSNAPVVMTLPQAHFLLPMPVKKTQESTNATLQTRALLPLMFMSWMVSLILISFWASLFILPVAFGY